MFHFFSFPLKFFPKGCKQRLLSMFHENCSVTLSNLSQNGYDLRVLCSIKIFQFPYQICPISKRFWLEFVMFHQIYSVSLSNKDYGLKVFHHIVKKVWPNSLSNLSQILSNIHPLTLVYLIKVQHVLFFFENFQPD